MRNERGFTLLEVLVALVIASVAAALILSHVRTLMTRAEREQAHQLAAMQLLNDSARMRPDSIPVGVVITQEKDALIVELADPAKREMQTIRVSNFTMNGEIIPPIDLAYTPFQRYEISRNRYMLSVLAPALKPPSATVTTSIQPTTASASSVNPTSN